MFYKMRLVGCLIIFIGFLFSGGCKKEGLTRNEIEKNNFAVAVIDSESSVMALTLYNHLARSNLLEDGGIIDSSIYYDTLKAIILDSIISLEANDVDLKQDAGLYRTYLMRYQDFYINYLYKNFILDSIKVDSIVVDSFYWAHPEYFSNREQVRAKHLVISAEGLRYGNDSVIFKDYSMEELDSIAREKVFVIREEIEKGAKLGKMAFEHSMHRETGKNDGELGYFYRNTFREEFEHVAFSLSPGTISQPFKTADGWHIVEVIARVDSGMAPLTPELYNKAYNAYISGFVMERGASFMDSLMDASEIIYNDSALSGDVYYCPESVWAAIVNSIDTITFFRISDFIYQHKMKKRLDTVTTDDIKDMLFDRAKKLLLIQAGDDMGFGDRPDVETKRLELYHKYAKNIVRQSSSNRDYIPPDSLIADYYNRNIDRFVFKKPIYVQQIIVEDSLFGEFLREQALSGVDFLELAQEYYPGEEEIRTAAADLGYIGSGEMPESFYRVALATHIKGVSHPVKTEWGYHIIKVIDKKDNRSLNDARTEIIGDLKKLQQKETLIEWKKDLIARHQIDYYLDKIPQIRLAPKEKR